MRVNALQPNLRSAIAAVSRAVAGKSTLPVLSNILIAARDGRLDLAATNLDIGITIRIPAQIEEEGAVTVPAKLFADVVGSLPNDKVTLALDPRTQTLKVAGGKSTSNIKGIDAEEFPTIPGATGARKYATLPAREFAVAVGQVAFCAASDDSRPVLAGVSLAVTPTGDALTLAAADGFRLATRRVALGQLTELGLPPLIVPARALIDAAGLAGDAEDAVTLSTTPGSTQLIVEAGAATLVSRLIDGRFPDFERIIPQSHTTRAIVDLAEIRKVVKLASYFAASSQGVVKLMSSPEGGQGAIVVSANAAEVGDSKGEMDAMVSGDEAVIALNATYLAAALAAIPTAQAAIELQTPQSPAVIKPVGYEAELLHIVMSMRLR